MKFAYLYLNQPFLYYY